MSLFRPRQPRLGFEIHDIPRAAVFIQKHHAGNPPAGQLFSRDQNHLHGLTTVGFPIAPGAPDVSRILLFGVFYLTHVVHGGWAARKANGCVLLPHGDLSRGSQQRPSQLFVPKTDSIQEGSRGRLGRFRGNLLGPLVNVCWSRFCWSWWRDGRWIRYGLIHLGAYPGQYDLRLLFRFRATTGGDCNQQHNGTLIRTAGQGVPPGPTRTNTSAKCRHALEIGQDEAAQLARFERLLAINSSRFARKLNPGVHTARLPILGPRRPARVDRGPARIRKSRWECDTPGYHRCSDCSGR